MKMFLSLILLSLVASCGRGKNNKSGEDVYFPESRRSSDTVNEQGIDSDSDGIFDSVEIENKTNPYEAQLPLVQLNQLENIKLNLGLIYNNENLFSCYFKQLHLNYPNSRFFGTVHSIFTSPIICSYKTYTYAANKSVYRIKRFK
jgi:hypothetical protein